MGTNSMWQFLVEMSEYLCCGACDCASSSLCAGTGSGCWTWQTTGGCGSARTSRRPRSPRPPCSRRCYSWSSCPYAPCGKTEGNTPTQLGFINSCLCRCEERKLAKGHARFIKARLLQRTQGEMLRNCAAFILLNKLSALCLLALWLQSEMKTTPSTPGRWDRITP